MQPDSAPSPFERRRHRRRYELVGHARFLTFGCYRRIPLFFGDELKTRFVACLCESRARHGFRLHAYVVMPDHVHLLLTPPVPEATVTTILQQLKGDFAMEAMRVMERDRAAVIERLVSTDGRRRFWQRGGGYDRNIFTMDEALEKLRYIHANPVRKGLVEEPCAYRWSSAAWWTHRVVGAPALEALE